MIAFNRIRPALSIRAKLLASFMLVAMFTGALGLNAVATVGRVNASRDAEYADVFDNTRLLVAWLSQARVSEGDLSEFMFETDPVARTALRAEMAAADANLAELGAQFDASGADLSDPGTTATLGEAWRAYTQWRDQAILAPLEADQWVEARAAFQTEGDLRSANVDRAVVAFNNAQNVSAIALESAADAESDVEVQIAVGLTAGAMLLALLIGYFLSRHIARAAGQVATAAKGLAVGDLDQHITVRSADELGQMADAVRSMIAYQHEMAEVARAVAMGDLTQDVVPKSAADVLGIAFGRMTTNLRTLVGDLQHQTATLTGQAQLLELANDAIIVSDFETGNIQFWNHGAEEVYGWTRADALGTTPQALLATRFPESKSAVDAELLRSGRWDGELVHTRRDGELVVIASRQAVQRDQAGQALAVLHINTNISAHKRAEKERTWLADQVERERTTLASVLASMTDGLVLLNEDRRVTFCNAPAAAMLGSTIETLTGNTAAEFFELQRSLMLDPEHVLESIDSQLAERPSLEIVFKGPPQRSVLLQRFAIGGTGAIGTLLHDQTTERALARAKDELVSTVSHELRTPIASLVGFTELLLNRTYSEKRRQEFLGIMLLEGRRLTGLINDFLDLQHMDDNSWRITPTLIDPAATIAQAVAAVGDDPTRPIVVVLPPNLPLIRADEARFQQVFGNLIGNARKYSPEGGAIHVSARVVGRMLTVEVRDQGLGLPPESIGKLFSKFYRVDNSDRRAIKGTGLGLAICRKIIEAHGGSIWAESPGLGEGSVFSFTMPIAMAAPGPDATVLIVEDNDAFARLLEEELCALGQASARAASAEEGWEWLETLTPGVLLLDLKLPGVSGQTFLRRVREQGNATLPVVIVTMLDLTPAAELELAQLGALVLRKSHTSAATAAALTVSLLAGQAEPPGLTPALSLADTDPGRAA